MSSKSYITENFATSLGLSYEGQKTISLGVFGSDKPELSFKSFVSKIGIESEFGESFIFTVHTRNVISMPTSAATITPEEVEEMQLGKQGLNVDWLQPDILLGIDCYRELIVIFWELIVASKI